MLMLPDRLWYYCTAVLLGTEEHNIIKQWWFSGKINAPDDGGPSSKLMSNILFLFHTGSPSSNPGQKYLFFIFGMNEKRWSCYGRGGAQRPVWHVNEPKKTGARMRRQSPLEVYVFVWLECSNDPPRRPPWTACVHFCDSYPIDVLHLNFNILCMLLL